MAIGAYAAFSLIKLNRSPLFFMWARIVFSAGFCTVLNPKIKAINPKVELCKLNSRNKKAAQPRTNGFVKRFFTGRGRRDRTLGTRFWRPMLYQLSYTPIIKKCLLWWTITDSNRGPTGYEPVALTN